MISKNSNLNEPFLLKPARVEKLWGSSRLNFRFPGYSGCAPIGESWECSTHPDGLSYVSSGIFKGLSLKEVIERHPEFLGEHLYGINDLPIIIKLIDASKDLSIQVHPDDEYAMKNENGSLGKNEMWYVIEAERNSMLIYGLQHEISRDELKESINQNTIEKYIQKVQVKKGEVFFVKPGTIHAIGAGVLLAEIQQNSNITYRLFDYNRTDRNGKKRELHINKALDVIEYKPSVEPRQPMRVLKYSKGYATELLCRCRYFQAERLIINVLVTENALEYQTRITSFEVLLCVKGNGSLKINDDNIIDFYLGDCIFFPANSKKAYLSGNAELIKVYC